MTDQPQSCPGCNRPVSPALDYIFVPAENKRWHPDCYRATYPEQFEHEKEERQ